MCISSRPSKMCDTKIYVGEGSSRNKYVHVLAYQNTAITDQPNAMILPIPTSESIDESNVIDTTSFKHFLKDISEASRFKQRATRAMKSLTLSYDSLPKVFQSGSYHVLLADSIEGVQEALLQIPENKRPVVTNEFLVGFAKLYPTSKILIACWRGEVAAEPILIQYVPTNKDVFHIPCMDAHSGKAPVLSNSVTMDHVISVGSNNANKVKSMFKPTWTNDIPEEYRSLMPVAVHGTKVTKSFPTNGDCFVLVDHLAKMESDKQIMPSLMRGHDADIHHVTRFNGWSLD